MIGKGSALTFIVLRTTKVVQVEMATLYDVDESVFRKGVDEVGGKPQT